MEGIPSKELTFPFFSLVCVFVFLCFYIYLPHTLADFIGLANSALPELSSRLYRSMELVENSLFSKAKVTTKKAIPTLVYQMEQADNAIMRLSKASGLNLVLNAKRPANRLFRFSMQAKVRSKYQLCIASTLQFLLDML